MNYDELVVELLEKRGVKTEEEREKFLNPDYEEGTHDPFLLVDMEKAVERVLLAIENKEKIVIYADFDCDGIPGAVVLHDFFKKIGYENFEVYIPHRHNEGYGFHSEAVNKLADNGVNLIITVDVGITAVDAVARANELGVDVIITDHHELNGRLPAATAVVNPKRDGYPFPDICGAAVAYKLVQAVLRRGREASAPWVKDIPEGWEKWLLDMVGIATIADMVPLIDENRALAYWGLRVLRKSPRPGILALMRKLRLTQSELTEDDIGFSIAPRVNAASRMDEPELAHRLLATSDITEATELVGKLEKLNNERKGTVAAMVRSAKKRLSERETDTPVIVLGDPNWKPSLTGLVANSVLDSRGGMVCVWGRDGTGALKGSCRSDGSIHVVDTFVAAERHLEVYGGHAQAGGFTVSNENVHTIHEILNNVCNVDDDTDLEKEKSASDALLSMGISFWDLYSKIARLAPFGIDNPKPIFLLPNVRISDVRIFGKEQNHTEVILENGAGTLRAFQFFKTPDTFSSPPKPETVANILGTIERDAFKGREAVALRIVDISV